MTEYIDILMPFLPLIVSLLIGAGGAYWLFVKKKLGEFADLAEEFAKAMKELVKAVEDDSVTEAEFRVVFAQFVVVVNKILAFVGKPSVMTKR